MKEFYEKNKDIIVKILFMAFVLLFIYLFFKTIFKYVAPFVVGYIFSIILNPLANFLIKKLKMGRGLAAISSMVITFTALGFLSRSLFSRIFSEGIEFIRELPNVVTMVIGVFDDLVLRYNNIYNLIPVEFQQTFENLGTGILNSVTGLVGSGIKTGSTNIVSVVPGFLLGFLLSLVSCYFFIKDKHVIGGYISDTVPESIKRKFSILKNSVAGAMTGYFRAQLIIMSVIATICATGMFILRIPYALFLAIIIAIVDALPVFGSGFFYWPWIAFSLISGDYRRAMGLGIIYIIVLITRQILEPKIVGQQIGIHPLVTLMSIYIGLRIFGVLGIIMGPCLVVIIKGIMDAPALTE